MANVATGSSELNLSVLIIDDDPEVNRSLSTVLETLGYSTTTAYTGEQGIELLTSRSFDLVMCDLKLPGASGLEVLSSHARQVSIILMTAFSNQEIAGQAARYGAFDYIRKPIFPDDLLFTLKRFEEREKLRRENDSLRASLSERYSFNNIIAKSESFKGVFEVIKRLTPFNTTVLITGESGTGKELIARAIHENSPRRGKPFIAINCGAIPETLMESELFGHKKGAFTDASRDKRGLFEEAHGGTLFLDEVGDLPLHLQVKLLRALQQQVIRRVGDEHDIPIDVRIVSATLRDLDHEVRQGRFREDLLYRINVISIHLDPLRERTEDITILIEHFLNKHTARLGITKKTVPNDVLKALVNYSWPGNARELENCLERALVLSPGDTLELSSLPAHISAATTKGGERRGLDQGDNQELSIKERTLALERKLIEQALKRTDGNRTHAAKLLNISHRNLLYKIKQHGLE
ncbi:MAG: sigma-54-dependent transcriptional regulator [Pseudomonadota bacterium]|jgi:two-component system response regulator AtoC